MTFFDRSEHGRTPWHSGEKMIRSRIHVSLVPCFEPRRSFFTRADAFESSSFDFELSNVIRATSATPSMLKLSSSDGKILYLAMDGGLVMNNPIAATITHVLFERELSSVIKKEIGAMIRLQVL